MEGNGIIFSDEEMFDDTVKTMVLTTPHFERETYNRNDPKRIASKIVRDLETRRPERRKLWTTISGQATV